MSAAMIPPPPVPAVVELVKRALREYLDEVAECEVRDVNVTSLAHHVVDRIRHGHTAPVVTVEADQAPPHGIRRPMMLVRGLDSDPFIRRP